MRVKIETLSSNGKGIAIIKEGEFSKTVFVEKGVPLDILEIDITAKNKIYYEAIIKEIITPSPNRIKPICPHFDVCGACDYLHIDYDTQINEKKKQLLHHLNKEGFKDFDFELIKSEKELHYRDRARVQVKEHVVGFLAKKTSTIIPIKKCYILREELNEIFRLNNMGDGEVKFAYNYADKKIYSEHDDVLCSYEVCGFKLLFSPKGFVQNNLTLNEKLVNVVVENVCGTKILDLYAGNGNFSIPLSTKGFVTAVEGDRIGFELLEKNIHHNNITNITAIKSNANTFDTIGFDTIVLDPPRVGAQNIERMNSKKIIYVSCNPRQLIRDMKKLVNYNIAKIVLVDMFPQTVHFEVVAVMELKSYSKQ